MNEDFTEEQLKCKGEAFTWMQKMGEKYMPNNDFVKNQYDIWQDDMKEISENQLTMGIRHGDVGPKDFFFENGNFTGIMDFNATGYGYFLSDVVAMMMYCDLINEERMDKFRIFIDNYLKTAPVKKEELKMLDFLLRARWFVDIFYHQFRYEEQITQGMENGDYKENLRGVKGGIEMLRTTNKYPPNYFFNVIK